MNIYRFKKFDLRMTDFLSGKKVAPSRDEWKICECCGQAIVKGFEMSNGDMVGEDCEDIIIRFKTAQLCNSQTVEQFSNAREIMCGKLKPAIKKYLDKIA